MKKYLQVAAATIFGGILIGALTLSNAWASPTGYSWTGNARTDVRSAAAPSVVQQGGPLNASRATNLAPPVRPHVLPEQQPPWGKVPVLLRDQSIGTRPNDASRQPKPSRICGFIYPDGSGEPCPQ